MPRILSKQLALARCPHCATARPTLEEKTTFSTYNHYRDNPRTWRVYICTTCGGVVTAWARLEDYPIEELYPNLDDDIPADIPERAARYLTEALQSPPTGAVMLAASAIDAMLKAKGLAEGSLHERIVKATETGIVTPEIAAWAHDVRLDANDQRHADDTAGLPTADDSKRVLEFTKTIGTLLFTLPARVKRGHAAAAEAAKKSAGAGKKTPKS